MTEATKSAKKSSLKKKCKESIAAPSLVQTNLMSLEPTAASLSLLASEDTVRQQTSLSTASEKGPSTVNNNTFESLINAQHTSGFWPAEAKLNLAVFLQGAQTEDPFVREALAQETALTVESE